MKIIRNLILEGHFGALSYRKVQELLDKKYGVGKVKIEPARHPTRPALPYYQCREVSTNTIWKGRTPKLAAEPWLGKLDESAAGNYYKQKYFVAQTHPQEHVHQYIGISIKDIDDAIGLITKKTPLNVQVVTIKEKASWKDVEDYLDKMSETDYKLLLGKGVDPKHVTLL